MADYEALKVIFVQLDSIDCVTSGEVDANMEKTLCWIDRAKAAYPDTDLIVFPECGIQGGHPSPDGDVPFPIPGKRMRPLLDKCREKAVWAVFNFLEADGGKVYNTSVLADAEGEIKIKYRKVNPFVPVEANYPGSEFYVCAGPKGAVFGLMTCYDGDFPEVGRELAYMGANVFLRPASYMDPFAHAWEITNRARAYENTAYVIAPNRCGTGALFTCFGNSMAVDYDGRIISQAPPGSEWMAKADIYPELAAKLRTERRTINHLHNLRHRGYTAVLPDGLTDNPYKKAYGDWV